MPLKAVLKKIALAVFSSLRVWAEERMAHKVIVEFSESEERLWKALCAESSFSKTPISELIKTDVQVSTRQLVSRVSGDKNLVSKLEKIDSKLLGDLLGVL